MNALRRKALYARGQWDPQRPAYHDPEANLTEEEREALREEERDRAEAKLDAEEER